MTIKGKVIPVQALEALRVERSLGSHLFRHSAHIWRQGCHPCAPAAFYSPGRFLVLMSVRGWVDPRAIMRLQGLGKLKIYTSFGTRTGDLIAHIWGSLQTQQFCFPLEDLSANFFSDVVRSEIIVELLTSCTRCHWVQRRGTSLYNLQHPIPEMLV
jgi:hypothetical protein